MQSKLLLCIEHRAQLRGTGQSTQRTGRRGRAASHPQLIRRDRVRPLYSIVSYVSL